jgi:hypothetical protein
LSICWPCKEAFANATKKQRMKQSRVNLDNNIS